MADYGMLQNFKGQLGAQREAEARALQTQLLQAQIGEAKQKAAYTDVDKLGEQAIFKALQGVELTPQEQAAAKYTGAKGGGVGFDPNTGSIYNKPNLATQLGINFGGANPNMPATSQGFVPPQAAQNAQAIQQGGITPQVGNQPQVAPESKNPWDIEYEQQMAQAAGNPKLQQSIMDKYAAAKLSMTEAEAKNAGYADRLLQAEPILTDPNKIEAYSNFWQKAGDFINPFGAQLQSPDYKSYKQAKTNAATARLRQESGATISPSEFDVDAEQLYPQVGDPPEVIEQKRQNREAIKAAMQRAAGPAYKPAPILSPKGEKDKAKFDAKKKAKSGSPIVDYNDL